MINFDWQLLLSQGAIKVLRIIFIIGGSWLIQKALIVFLKQFKNRFPSSTHESFKQKQQRIKTLSSLFVNTSKIIISLITFLLVLTELGVNILPLLTGLGILGLGIGMGAKTLMSDIIAGFFILLENQFNVGDWVKLESIEGKVNKISLRTITLKDKKGDIYIVPNSSIKIVKKFKNRV